MYHVQDSMLSTYFGIGKPDSVLELKNLASHHRGALNEGKT